MNLKIENLTVHLSGKTILKDVNLSVTDGEIISLLGISGSGKSTLLKTIAGLLEPTSGTVLLDGQSAEELPPHKRNTVIVFQDLRLFPHMTVEDNVAFPLKMRGMNKEEGREKARLYLEKVQLDGFEKRKIHQLSGGQMQRVALARALASEPGILLLDEPFSSLDENLREDMRQLLLRLRMEFKITTILVTHDRQEALGMSDRIALIEGGNILQYDTPDQLYHRPHSLEVAKYFEYAGICDGEIRDNVLTCPAGHFPIEKPDGLYHVIFRKNTISLGQKNAVSPAFRMTEIRYLGSGYIATLQAAHSLFAVQIHIEAPQQISLSQPVYLEFNVNDSILLPKDSSNIKEPS